MTDTANHAPQSEAGRLENSERKGSKSHHLLDAFENWQAYHEATHSLVALTYAGFARTSNAPELFRILESGQARIDQAKREAERAQKEIDANFPTLHAHSLLGLWGSLECLVEDIFKASIKADPTLLSADAFAKIKLPMDILFSSDDERADTVLNELVRATSAEKSVGVTQFERILKPINLGGQVPTRVKEAVFLAQQIRHIWAHRGGVADATFVGRCPNRVEIGDKVHMDREEFSYLSAGLTMYGYLIFNRQFKNVGASMVPTEFPGYEGIFEEVGLVSPSEE